MVEQGTTYPKPGFWVPCRCRTVEKMVLRKFIIFLQFFLMIFKSIQKSNFLYTLSITCWYALAGDIFVTPHAPFSPLSHLMTRTRVYIFVFDDAFSVNLMEVVIALVNDSWINILSFLLCHFISLFTCNYPNKIILFSLFLMTFYCRALSKTNARICFFDR